jgi:hypothetical protein
MYFYDSTSKACSCKIFALKLLFRRTYAGAYIDFLPMTADRICYLGKKLEYVQLFSGRKFVVSQENKKKNEKTNDEIL